MKLFDFFRQKSPSKDKKITLQELEDLLIRSDFGLPLTESLIEKIKTTKAKNQEEIETSLKQQLMEILSAPPAFSILDVEAIRAQKAQNKRSAMVLVNVGTNGVGKTTSCAKMAYYFSNQGYKVALVAADTFRSGAVNQLKFWAEKYQIHFFDSPHQEPSAIAYSALEQLTQDFDMIIIDSAGRSINAANLMSQIAKMHRIVVNSNLPQKTLLTLDGTNGLQAREQTRIFSENLKLDGLIITKLDGTAKAGVLFDITEQYSIPVAFVGKGEKITDLELFSKEKFIARIL